MRLIPLKSAEFKARQLCLDLAEAIQGAISTTRAELQANMARIKQQWVKWFPRPTLTRRQLVIELDELAQIPLFVTVTGN